MAEEGLHRVRKGHSYGNRIRRKEGGRSDQGRPRLACGRLGADGCGARSGHSAGWWRSGFHEVCGGQAQGLRGGGNRLDTQAASGDRDDGRRACRRARLNEDPACTGYIIQLPLPAHIDSNAIISAIDPVKDADGMHPYNLGNWCCMFGVTSPLHCPALPAGCSPSSTPTA